MITFNLACKIEDRLHLENIQINLIFLSVCTIFVPIFMPIP